nr:hypothetical protein [Pandoravirus belohorizontensis]
MTAEVPRRTTTPRHEMDGVLDETLKHKRGEANERMAMYEGLHRMHGYFVGAAWAACPRDDWGGQRAWRYATFDEVCAKAIRLPRAAVNTNMREVLVMRLMRRVLLAPSAPNTAHDDAAVAEDMAPSACRSLVPLVGAASPHAEWLDWSPEQIETWFAGPGRAGLRAALMRIWCRARLEMVLGDDSCMFARHLSAACAAERNRPVVRPTSARTAPTPMPGAAAGVETRVSWNRTTHHGGPSTTVSSGTRTTTVTAHAVAECGVGVKRPRSLVDDDGDNNTDGGGDSRDAAYGNGDDDDGDNLQSQRQRRRTDAHVSGGVSVGGCTDDGAQRASLAARLQSGFAAVTALGEPGLMLQAATRVLSLCTPEETRALVARAYALIVPSPSTGVDVYDDGDDDSNDGGIKVPGPHAPAAFVAWFALHHAAYGLENTPDYVWNTKLLPTSPREDDPWSRAYWLARAKSRPLSQSPSVTASSDVRSHPSQ